MGYKNAKEYINKGFVLNDDMLKNSKPFGRDYFNELPERIREIRASGRWAYQKIADVFEQCSYDYDKNRETTKAFYAFVQNKLRFAFTGKTAAGLISERAALDSPTMDLDAIVVNAAHMKALPGLKTDMKDAEWIADLLRHGLLKASYIPSRGQREIREITRYRKSLTEEWCRESNRLQKILEGANIKLDSVVKDINGKSVRKLLKKIIEDDVPTSEEEISKMIHGRMRSKLGQLVTAIEGITTPLQRKRLAQVIDHIDDLNRRIADLDKLVQDYMDEYEAVIIALCDIPGIARRSAEVFLAEISLDMSRFPSAAHLCSWAGVCPGNCQSAGRRKHGKTINGNMLLKTILTQCAKSARSVKGAYFSVQYQRIAARRGKNRATLAVAHSMLIAIYHMLRSNVPFRDLASDYYDSFNRDRKIHGYLKRLKALGWEPDALPGSA